MSIELQQVKRRIASARQIQQVTSALQRVSSARLANDRRAMERSHRFTVELRRVMQEVGAEAGDVEHPYLERTGGPHCGMIVFGSDKGLCGGYNRMLMEALQEFASKRRGTPLRLIIVGRVIARRARRMGLVVTRFFAQPSRKGRSKQVDAITDLACSMFRPVDSGAVYLLYTRFLTAWRQRPVLEKLLPVELSRPESGPLPAAEFEPDPCTLLQTLVPEVVRQSVDHAFLNSVASENAARQTAMSRASENASELLSDLSRTYRRLRQESITTEMLELAGGTTGRNA